MTAIKVENLSKKYIIGHQKQERYTSLRDVMMHKLRGMGERIRHPLSLNREEIDIEEFWALKDINLEIGQGDRLGIIGRNGAGKSTLLKVLSRITEPTKGRITINGRVASLLEVGTGFHPELTGRENIFLNGAILGMGNHEIKNKLDEIIHFAEVEKFLDTPVKRYSSGMYVRLAFSVAAHLEPEVLVIDEVLAVGDAQFQKKCLGKMEKQSGEGRTILFVSHNLNAIRMLCNKVMMLKNGSVDGFGEPSEIIGRYSEDIKAGGMMTREWSSPGRSPQNSGMMLRKASLTDAAGKQLQEVFTNTEFNIQLEIVAKNPGTSVGLTMIVYDAEGNCVFSSINNRDSEWYGKSVSAGIYRVLCRIPANYFNNGWFSIAVNMFGRNFSDSKMEKDVLRFEIQDSSEIRGDYHGEFAGCVRPALEWRTWALDGQNIS